MKINFLLTAIIATTITSCSTSYKTLQTPDDVYYSPPRYQSYDVKNDREVNSTNDNTVYTSTDDRYIRRRVKNRRYRRYDDRYDYPYGYNGVYGNPKITNPQTTSEPRKTNLGAYQPNVSPSDTNKSSNPKMAMQKQTDANSNGANPSRTFKTGSSNTNRGTAVGNAIRRIFPEASSSNRSSGNSNGNYNNSNSSTRSFESSSNTNNNSSNNSSSTNSSSGSKSSSSTSAPVRTFGKQN